MSFQKFIEILLSPIVEFSCFLGLLYFFFEFFYQVEIRIDFFGLNVPLVLQQFYLLRLHVEVESGKGEQPCKLPQLSISFLRPIHPSHFPSFPNLQQLFNDLPPRILISALLFFSLIRKGIELVGIVFILHFHVLLHFFKLVFILFLSHLNYLIDVSVDVIQLHSKYLPFPQEGDAVEVDPLKRVFLLFVGDQGSFLDDQLVPDELVLLKLQHPLLDGVLRDHLIDVHVVLLPNAIGPVHRLVIVLGVPVDVVNYHSVCRHQIYPKPSCLRRKQEDRNVGLVVELLHLLLSVLDGGRPVDPAKLILFHVAVVDQEIQLHRKLRKNQDFMLLGDQLAH